jgi:hypothetical protein
MNNKISLGKCGAQYCSYSNLSSKKKTRLGYQPRLVGLGDGLETGLDGLVGLVGLD